MAFRSPCHRSIPSVPAGRDPPCTAGRHLPPISSHGATPTGLHIIWNRLRASALSSSLAVVRSGRPCRTEQVRAFLPPPAADRQAWVDQALHFLARLPSSTCATGPQRHPCISGLMTYTRTPNTFRVKVIHHRIGHGSPTRPAVASAPPPPTMKLQVCPPLHPARRNLPEMRRHYLAGHIEDASRCMPGLIQCSATSNM